MLKTFISLCLLVSAAIAALFAYPGLAILPFAPFVSYIPYCTLWKGVVDANTKLVQAENVKSLQRQSRVVKTDGKLRLWETPLGNYWVPGDNLEILPILLAQQQRKIYGSETSGGVRAGDIVLDCGAHIGTYVKTALAAGALKVIAIEPSADALLALRRNVAAEVAAGRVIIVEKGVWDKEDRLQFFENGDGAAGDGFLTRADNAKVVTNVPVTTIDKIVAELKLPRVDLIKADVKGAGERMIRGAVAVIKEFHPRIVISTEEAPEDPVKINTAVMSLSGSYRFRCGPCLLDGKELRPEVVFYH